MRYDNHREGAEAEILPLYDRMKCTRQHTGGNISISVRLARVKSIEDSPAVELGWNREHSLAPEFIRSEAFLLS